MNERDKIMRDMTSHMGKYVELAAKDRERLQKKRIKEIDRKIKIILSKYLSRNYSFTQTYAELFIEKLDEMIELIKKNNKMRRNEK